MTCIACRIVRQLAINLALLADHAMNGILLGDPNETLSARTARARRAGSVAARRFCAVLTFVLRGHGDHCAWALDNTGPSIGRELWSWDTDRLEPDGVAEAVVRDDGA